MKHMILIALFVLSMSAGAQTTRLFFIDTIVVNEYVTYTNTFDDIALYHESDWLLYETEADDNGDWMQMYYNDTSFEPTVYVYYMTEELCYKMVTLTDDASIQQAEIILSAK